MSLRPWASGSIAIQTSGRASPAKRLRLRQTPAVKPRSPWSRTRSSLIRRRPEMFVGEAPLRPEFLAAGLAQDALALGVKQAEIDHVGAWWVVVSDEDWLAYGNDRSVRETFSHILPFPSLRSQCLPVRGRGQCPGKLPVHREGRRLEILRGDEAAIRDVLTLDLFRRAGTQRMVAFRMTDGAAAMPGAESSRTDGFQLALGHNQAATIRAKGWAAMTRSKSATASHPGSSPGQAFGGTCAQPRTPGRRDARSARRTRPGNNARRSISRRSGTSRPGHRTQRDRQVWA